MKKILVITVEDAVFTASPTQPAAASEWSLVTNVITAVRQLSDAGFESLLVANSEPRLLQAQGLLESQGVSVLAAVHAGDHTGLLAALAATLTPLALDVANSRVVGSGQTAQALAQGLSLQVLDLEALGWPQVAQQLITADRTASGERRSNETSISVAVNLDQQPPQIHVATGIGFFDHMLEQLAKHGGFSLQLTCDGDLHIDEHHTVEDCGLALGETLRTALGDKRGLARYGFLLPMDETEVQSSIDLSARPWFVFEGDFSRDAVGELSTEMVPHFFKSFSDTLGASLHIRMRGDNAHHQVEATFKSVGRALRQALAREGVELPTTKGML